MAEAIETAPGGARARDGAPRYRPIRDYAAIGDCHGAALVGRDGSIDWCTLGRFDADPVFCRLLDADRGGFWSIRPSAAFRALRSYLPGSNILRTVFTTADGEVALTDFMPVGRRLDAGATDYVTLSAPGWLVRRIEGLEGTVELVVRYRPSRAFARYPTELTIEGGAVHGEGVPSLFTELELRAEGDTATARLDLAAGGYHDLVLAPAAVPGHPPTERVPELFQITRAFWAEWLAQCRYRGPYRDAVRRSALALKLMTYAPTGAVVAALTTSLPEAPGAPDGAGGQRNRDDRLCCLGDACSALYALAALGYRDEARRFCDYLGAAVRQTLPRLQGSYGIGHEPEHELSGRVLDHLEGHAGRGPVRIGGGAPGRPRLDVYGQALDQALLYQSLGGRLGAQDLRSLATLAAFVATRWQAPDQGRWQQPGPPRQHLSSKLMSWVALDRARRLLDDGQGWAALADRIQGQIVARALDPQRGHLAQAFDGGVDAAALLAPMLDLPVGREILEQTIDTVEHALAEGDFLGRATGADGLSGGAAAALICSFWLVDAKLALGQLDDARALFERLLKCANDVGLYAATIDPYSGALLGNFPRSSVHLALIGSAVNLQLCARRGAAGLAGTHAERARRAAGRIFGWRGMGAWLQQRCRLGRLRSSPASKLAWP